LIPVKPCGTPAETGGSITRAEKGIKKETLPESKDFKGKMGRPARRRGFVSAFVFGALVDRMVDTCDWLPGKRF
jgi:hypothetical protein